MVKIAFFDAKQYDIDSFNLVNKDYDIQYFESKLSIKNVVLTKGFDAVCVFVNDELSKEVIDELYNNGVGIILLRCAGFNNVDVKSAYGKIHVTRVPAYSPNAIAEHAFALILSLNRKIHRAYIRTRDFNFNISGLTGFNLSGKNIGVIGTGKIGQGVIKIAKGFGMNVYGYDPFPNHDLDINYVSLDELYQVSDIISLHSPLTTETHHMIDEDAISKMKDGVMLINTSRGGLVDSKALLNGLKTKKISSAGLDVYEEESDLFFEDKSNTIISDDILSLLISLPNVIITSHQGYLTKEALDNIATTTLFNLNEYLNGKLLTNEVCYKCKVNPQDCYKKRNKKCF